MRPLWSVMAAWAVTGCSGVPMAAGDLDAAAKRFEPPRPGMGALYVVREGYLVISPTAVMIDQRQVGRLGYDTFLRVELPPGIHDVRAQDLDTRQQLAVTIVRLAVGEIRYVVLANAMFDAPLARSVTEITARE